MAIGENYIFPGKWGDPWTTPKTTTAIKINVTPKDWAKELLIPSEDELLRERIAEMDEEELRRFVENLIFGG